MQCFVFSERLAHLQGFLSLTEESLKMLFSYTLCQAEVRCKLSVKSKQPVNNTLLAC